MNRLSASFRRESLNSVKSNHAIYLIISMRGVFVTGTGTGVGKTLVSAGLAWALRKRNVNVAVMKPFATAAKYYSSKYKSQDTAILAEACGTSEPVAETQPPEPAEPQVAQEPLFPPPPAEHLAVGQLQDVDLTARTMVLRDADGNDQTFEFSDTTEVIGVAGTQGLSAQKGSQVTVRYIEQDNRKTAVLIHIENPGS